MTRFNLAQGLLIVAAGEVVLAVCRVRPGLVVGLTLFAAPLPGFLHGRDRDRLGIVGGMLSSSLLFALYQPIMACLAPIIETGVGQTVSRGHVLETVTGHIAENVMIGLVAGVWGCLFSSVLAGLLATFDRIRGAIEESPGDVGSTLVYRPFEEMPPRSRDWYWAGLTVPLLFPLSFIVYLGYVPPNRVKVSAINIPSGAYYVSFVAQRDGLIVNMDWWPLGELSPPTTMHPARCNWSYQSFPDRPSVLWDAWVRWEWGQKYGVLTRMRDESWHVFWFDEKQIPLQGRKFLLGGGLAEFDCRNAESEALATDYEIQRLGLQGVRNDEGVGSKSRPRVDP